MPLVMMCGFPCSGKSERVKELVSYAESEGRKCEVVSDHTLCPDLSAAYSNSQSEKKTRGILRSEVERLLAQDICVIVDSLNYIKGFRYELYCVARSLKTAHCIIQTLVNKETCVATHAEHDLPYGSGEVVEALMMRFEPPNPHQRWDNPTYSVTEEEPLPCKEIIDTLYSGNKKVRPHEATQSQPLSSTNFLFQVDKITQSVIAEVVRQQQRAQVGDKISITGTNKLIEVRKTKHTMSDLRRIRQAFMNYCKAHPSATSSDTAGLFVNFINNIKK
eukprot:m.11913 g.11913  ORF g.11913 m.11913 type:complete len:276 (-) comp7072_c0_seq1:28-855(-)